MKPYTAQVLVDGNGRPLIVFAKGRIKYHAVSARPTDIAVVTIDTLRGYRELTRRGEPYPVRRCASFWLNHDHRPLTKGARRILRNLVTRQSERRER